VRALSALLGLAGACTTAAASAYWCDQQGVVVLGLAALGLGAGGVVLGSSPTPPRIFLAVAAVLLVVTAALVGSIVLALLSECATLSLAAPAVAGVTR
jgi:hypothetical protein